MSETPAVPGYRILSVVGRGAMATVYRAEQERLQKTVALKVMDPVVAEDEEYRERFLREARAAAKLNHQNLVRALDAGCAGGFYYIAMELVEGVDLRRKIEEEGALPEKEALTIAVSVCHALDEASRNGIVHRDVKPENILLSQEGIVKLTDLGLAKVSGEDLTLTKKGLTVGTVAYFAPEQALGQPDLDVRTDIYALGATLYAAVSGELPFGRGENVPETMQRILTQPPPSLVELAPKLSEPARLVIERFMEKDRKKRPQSAREAIRLLESALAGEIPGPILQEKRVESARNSARKSMRRQAKIGAAGNKTTGVVVAAILAVAAVGLLLALMAKHEPAEAAPPPPDPKVGGPSREPSSVRPVVVTPSPAPVPTPVRVPAPVPTPVPVPTPDPDPVPGPVPGPAPTPVTEPPKDDSSAPDLSGLAKLVHAKVELVKDVAILRYDDFDDAALSDFEVGGVAPELAQGALVWKLGPGKHATVRHKVALVAPIVVAFDLQVVEQAAKARFETVIANAAGGGFGSCGGARLDAWEKGAASKRLAGSEGAESLFAQGRNHRVELELTDRTAIGSLDGTERFRAAYGAPEGATVGFDLVGGLKLEVRKLRIQGRIDKGWLQGAQK